MLRGQISAPFLFQRHISRRSSVESQWTESVAQISKWRIHRPSEIEHLLREHRIRSPASCFKYIHYSRDPLYQPCCKCKSDSIGGDTEVYAQWQLVSELRPSPAELNLFQVDKHIAAKYVVLKTVSVVSSNNNNVVGEQVGNSSSNNMVNWSVRLTFLDQQVIEVITVILFSSY